MPFSRCSPACFPSQRRRAAGRAALPPRARRISLPHVLAGVGTGASARPGGRRGWPRRRRGWRRRGRGWRCGRRR
ncbi:MAG: hypothetical protein F4Y54_04565 [Dehalococcoidia bacterium]|nr:hypothetical protein [Dehalococcoidia bacterium]